MLGLGFVLGLGLLFAWTRGRRVSAATEPPLLAVLPFENAGAADDDYFADGMTEEVRGRLAGLQGLRVIADNSSREYRGSEKSLPEIAKELGAEYLLTATVRWARAADGTSRVRVSPRLVQVGGGTATMRWQQPFDAALTDVFQVQADIAGRVADALDVALGTDQERELKGKPTDNLAAYDLYLRAINQDWSATAGLRRSAALLEQAVAEDPGFAQAWQSLSVASSNIYQNAPSPAAATRAREAAERAGALDSTGLRGFMAFTHYYYRVRGDLPAAERSARQALAIRPNDAGLLGYLSRTLEGQGRWDEALAAVRDARRLDPRNSFVLARLEDLLIWLRRYPEALAASDSLLLLDPGDLYDVQTRAMIYVAQGDLAGARAALELVSPAVTPLERAAYFANGWDMYWLLDDASQRLLLAAGPAAYPGERDTWAHVLMQIYALRGDRARARAYADTAYVATSAVLEHSPDDPQLRVLQGLQLAFLGRRAEAVAALDRGLELGSPERDRRFAPYYQHVAARAYLELGEPDKALDLIEAMLKAPYFVSPGWLRVDPSFAGLRGNGRFEALIR
jgi:TolB-like protein